MVNVTVITLLVQVSHPLPETSVPEQEDTKKQNKIIGAEKEDASQNGKLDAQTKSQTVQR